MIGKAFAMHVNARSSNHDPNHVLDRDPKRLSERDSSPCEHSHSSCNIYLTWDIKMQTFPRMVENASLVHSRIEVQVASVHLI